MLRTTITDALSDQKWILQGHLRGPWANDLRERWNETRGTRAGRNCIVDLEDVISVDETGEDTLLQMATEGAHLTATRAYMKHILGGLHVDY
jgi:anti-anti-sigma regulatory factor